MRSRVGVLKLIDQNVTKSLLVVATNKFIALQQLIRAQKQFGKIHHAFALALLLVSRIQFHALFAEIVPGLHRRCTLALIFAGVNEMLQLAGRKFLVVNIERLQQAFDR